MSDNWMNGVNDNNEAGFVSEPAASETTTDSEPVKTNETAGNEPTASEQPAELQEATTEEATAQTSHQQAATYSWVNPKVHQQADKAGFSGQTGFTGQANQTSFASQPDFQGQNSQSFNQKMNESGSQAGGGQTPPVADHPHNKKKPVSLKKKWMTTIALAASFGLVAGGVFTGVSAIGAKAINHSAYNAESTVPEETEKTPEVTPSTTENTGTKSNSTIAQTASVTNGSVAQVAATCMPSMVTISTTTVQELQSMFGGTQQYEATGAGSGVIIGENDEELLIATNYHVVQNATDLSVGFVDQSAVTAQLKGYDAEMDLAVIAVNKSDINEETKAQISICSIGSSDDLVLGEQIVAIGNALGYGESVTSGFVSAFDRSLDLTYMDGSSFVSENLIQVDAAINSGNSGGALLNMNGELVGINEAKSGSTGSGASVEGMGYAIPISKAMPVLEELMNMQTRTVVSQENACYIGVTCANITEETYEMYGIPVGVCFTSVVEGSPADQAGLKKGDVLTSFDGRSITSYSDLSQALAYYAAGETVELTIMRANDGEYMEQTISITLGSASDKPQTETSEDNEKEEYEQQSNPYQDYGNYSQNPFFNFGN